MTAWRERNRLAVAERGITTNDADTEQPVTMARVTGAEILRQMRELAGTLTAAAERLTGERLGLEVSAGRVTVRRPSAWTSASRTMYAEGDAP